MIVDISGTSVGRQRVIRLNLRSFCPTGPGGGVDPTCSPGGGVGGSAAEIISSLKTAGFTVLGLDDLSTEVLTPLASELLHLKSVAPGLVGQFGSIRTTSLPKDVPFTYRVEGGSRSFLVDPKQLSGAALAKTTATIEASQKSGWLASGDGLRGVIAHEVAHALDKAPFNAQLKFDVKVAAAKMYIKNNPPTKKDLSGYGVQAGPHQKEEAFAEAYAASRTKTTKTKWQEGFDAALSGGRRGN